MDKKLAQIEASSGYHIQISESYLSGLKSVHLNGIQVQKESDTLARLENLELDLNIWGFLSGKRLISSLEMHHGYVRKIKTYQKDTLSKTDTVKNDSRNLSDLPGRAYAVFQKYFPGEVSLYDFKVQYQDSIGFIQAKVDSILSMDKVFTGSLQLSDGIEEQDWIVSGEMESGIKVKCAPLVKKAMPVLSSRIATDLRLDSFSFYIHTTESKNGQFAFQADAQIEGLKLYHEKVSSDTIQFPFLRTRTQWRIHDGLVELDSNSTFTCNHVQGNYQLLFSIDQNQPVYGLGINTRMIAADSFFASLPGGAFDETRNLKAKGKLSYHLKFFLDGKQPDDVIFESGIDKENFGIISYPGIPLNLMNAPFEHSVYENNKLVRKFPVGTENPNFTPLDQVPKYLIEAILCSEDPSFFVHRGFIQEAFRESIAENYKSKSFKRGGSTISMQLVKNVFLSRKKTVFRKIEEALIVWLIENQRLSSKERMMEVYVNIIEWGPNVYGIKEASEYYFDKRVDDLTLSECIYLATIIPRPKKFAWAFEKDGSMKSYLKEQHLFLMRRMAQKEYLTTNDTAGYEVNVNIKGKAKELIQPDSDEDRKLFDFIPDLLELIPNLD